MWTLAWLALVPANAADESLKGLWQDLTDRDTITGFRAIRKMIRTPGCVEFLQGHLKPAADDEIARAIGDLDHESFDVRQKAEKALLESGGRCRPAVTRVLNAFENSLEFRRRLERVLEKVDALPLPVEDLRKVRAVEVLAGIDGAEAKRMLTALSKGAAGAPVTEAALSFLAARK